MITLLGASCGPQNEGQSVTFVRIKVMAQAFKVGDTVRLKSGGPRMRLTNVDDRGYVRTAWFAGAAKEHGHFHLDALIDAPTEPPNRRTLR